MYLKSSLFYDKNQKIKFKKKIQKVSLKNA